MLDISDLESTTSDDKVTKSVFISALLEEVESVRLTVCVGSMGYCRQRIVVGRRSAKKMVNWA